MAAADENRVYIFDTTLRDGEQAPGFALNVEEKVEIAHQLARLGVDVIEAGFPISSPGDFTACQRIAREVGTLDGAPMITALARAVPRDIDAVWNAIKDAPRKQIHIVLSVSDIHIQKKGLGTRQQVLEKGVAAIEYARQFCDLVEYSPEDAGRADRSYLYETVEAMIEAGASVINVPDTTGYTLPHEFGGMIGDLMRHVRNVGNAIIDTAGLSFLGLGTQPPTPDWGNMLSAGRSYVIDSPWIATFPGLASLLTVLAFNLMGDALRDAFDPRLR